MMTTAPNSAYRRPAPKRIEIDEDDRELRLVAATNTPDEVAARPIPARILLAEDDREFRALVAMRLRGAGFDVTEAADGNALLEHLVDAIHPDGTIDHFDLILSDIRMPHFTALDVMLGARSCIAETPVVLITAFGDASTHERALRLGAAAVLDKPFRLDDLCVTICQILTQQTHKSWPLPALGKLD